MSSARGQESWVSEKVEKEIDDGSVLEGDEGIRRHIMRNRAKGRLGLKVALAELRKCLSACGHSYGTVGSVED